MPTHRVKIAFITNASARKRTFWKRMQGLRKKLDELSTLCGIDACCIVFNTYEPQPDVWPSHSGVQHVLAQFLRMPEKDQFKKMENLQSYIREGIRKAEAELKKQRKKNCEEQMIALMYQCLIGNVSLANLNVKNLKDLGRLVDHNLSEINIRIQSLKKSVPADPAPHAVVGCSHLSVGIPKTMDGMQNPTYFMDLLMGSE